MFTLNHKDNYFCSQLKYDRERSAPPHEQFQSRCKSLPLTGIAFWANQQNRKVFDKTSQHHMNRVWLNFWNLNWSQWIINNLGPFSQWCPIPVSHLFRETWLMAWNHLVSSAWPFSRRQSNVFTTCLMFNLISFMAAGKIVLVWSRLKTRKLNTMRHQQNKTNGDLCWPLTVC